MIWSEKYAPKNVVDMIGNEDARTYVINWIMKWEKGTKPIMLIGPAGVGKTTIVKILAHKLDYDVICLNASDIRNKQQIEEIINPVLNNLNLFGKSLIFIDEVDGIHGKHDYGGVEALIKILKIPVIPIVLAANYEFTDKIKKIKKLTTAIYFHPIAPRLLLLYALDILKKESSSLSSNKLNDIIINSIGDVRFMINSLQTSVMGFNQQQEKSYMVQNIDKSVNDFFISNSIDKARNILYSLQVDPYTKINAFYSSIINSNIKLNDLSKMLETISDADILYGKILKTQSWHLLRYLNEILIDLYGYKYHIQYSKYNLSWPLINKIRFHGNKLKKLSLLLAKKFHISSNVFRTYYMPYILFYLNNTTQRKYDIDELVDEFE